MLTVKNGALWLRWIVANALGELLGLGTVILAGAGIVLLVGEPVGLLQNIGFPAVMVLLGAFEGSILGLAQSWVLRDRLPWLKSRSWTFATVVGAVGAWCLGMIPSFIGYLGDPAVSMGFPAMSDRLIFLLASLLGAVLGIVLALPQWWILRQYVHRAGWWIPANALAWASGMPVIFWQAGHSPANLIRQTLIAIALLAFMMAGAIVGAIHGAALL
ncbi:MAG: hypothetical protein AAF609_19660 [Cyanobacteria bacterium P01_C01_bin.120]